MEMNLNNTSESYDSRDTLSQEFAVKEFYKSGENCSCDTNCVCDSCSAQNCEIRETASKQNFPMCRYKNQKKNRTDDSHPNQNCDTDFHASEERADKKTTEQCVSKKNTSSPQNGEKDKSINAIFATDCNTLEESTDTAPTENSELSNIVDSRGTRRNSKRKRDIEDFCPVCGVAVRYSELASHYAKEVENLSKISNKTVKKIRSEEREGVNTTFVQVKSNRENRHAAKVAMFSTRPRNEVHCPVCNIKLAGSQEEINNHVLNCINEDESYEEINVIDDDEDSFEEYEFADQTRVRAISMVPGGYRTLQGDSSKHRRDDDDEDLNVDIDDTVAFGSPQYTELDVIRNPTDNTDKGLEQLRKAVLLDPSAERHVIETRKWGNNDDQSTNYENSDSSLDKNQGETNESCEALEQKCSENTEDLNSCVNKANSHVVSSLKEKIRDLEEQNKCVKCLICLEPYTKPVVSTTCWHVHCEECWLMTMGVKKLCPQCNIIVFPSDLRRIYL